MNSNAAAIKALEAKFEASKNALRAEFEASRIENRTRIGSLESRLSGIEKELRTLTTVLKARQVVHGAKKENKQGLTNFVGKNRLASWHSHAHPVMRTKREALEVASNLQKSIVSKNGRFGMSVNDAIAARDVVLRRSKKLGATNEEIETVRRGGGKEREVVTSVYRALSGVPNARPSTGGRSGQSGGGRSANPGGRGGPGGEDVYKKTQLWVIEPPVEISG